MVQWWFDWKKFGCFPFEGDAMDQPVEVYEVLCLCENTEVAVRQEQQQKGVEDD